MDDASLKQEIDRLYAEHEANSDDYHFGLLSETVFEHSNTGHLDNRMPESWRLKLDLESSPASRIPREVFFEIEIKKPSVTGEPTWQTVFKGKARNEDNFHVQLTFDDFVYYGGIESISHLTKDARQKIQKLNTLCENMIGEQLDKSYEAQIKAEIHQDLREIQANKVKAEEISNEIVEYLPRL